MLSLILPTYNEARSLPVLLPKIADVLAGLPHEVIIVDDNSPDGTWKIAQELTCDHPHMRVLRRIGRRGLSSAVIEGFLAAKGSVLCVMDADGQHDIALISRLAEAVEKHGGIAIGSRYVEGGSVGEWDEKRHAMSRLATSLALKLCKVPARDPMSGFFALDRATFEAALPHLNPKGFKILLDILVHVPARTPVTELPLQFGVRTHGESKLSGRVQIDFLEYLYDVTFGRYVSALFIKYCIVGVLGVGVNYTLYQLLSALPIGDMPLMSVPLAVLIGIEAAILFNFALNNLWTFARVQLRGMAAFRGLFVYNVACLFGALANIAIYQFLLSTAWNPVPAVLLGAAVGAVWNYTMSRLLTWNV